MSGPIVKPPWSPRMFAESMWRTREEWKNGSDKINKTITFPYFPYSDY